MSLHKLLSEYALSADCDRANAPERTFVWAIIIRAVWDSGTNSKVLKTYKEREGVRKYIRKDGSSRPSEQSIQQEASAWLMSESNDEFSLRWWLDLLNLEHDDVQPKLIEQIGKKTVRKAFTSSSRGPYKVRENKC